MRVIRMLEERGLGEKQALRLTENQPDDILQRILKIIEYFDTLCASGSHSVIKSPVGFLYKAVENPLSFKLPGDRPPGRGMQGSFTFNPSAEKRKEKAIENEEPLYLTERRRKISEIRVEMDNDLLARIEKEVEMALSNIRGMISGDRFREVVAHGVDEKLAKLFALPDFDEWKRSRSG